MRKIVMCKFFKLIIISFTFIIFNFSNIYAYDILKTSIGEEIYSYYLTENNTITLSSCTIGENKNIEIPSQIDGYDVTEILWITFFQYGNNLESVVLPDTIKILNGFGNQPFLKHIVLKDGIETIGDSAFYKCYSLDNVIIPDSVKTIGDNAFKNCSSLSNLKIPKTVTSINATAFEGTKWFENKEDGFIIEGDNVLITYKGNKNNIETLTLPENVKYIADYAFKDFENLKTIILPDGLIGIGHNAFDNCKSLKTIQIPKSVESLGYMAFVNCDSIETATIPENVKELGEGIFRDCNNLKSVSINTSIYGLEDTFEDCINLTSITLPKSLKSLGNYTFKNCSSLEYVDIPNSVESIGAETFKNCSNLKSIVLPKSLKTIERWVFDGCFSLDNISVPNDIEILNIDAFKNCKWFTDSKDKFLTGGSNILIAYNGTDEKLVIPENITKLRDGVFSGNTSIKEVVIHGGIEIIGYETFYNVPNLTNVTIEEGTKLIGYAAFQDSKALNKLILPSTIEYIDSTSFENCNNLKTIYGKKGSYAEIYANQNYKKFIEY